MIRVIWHKIRQSASTWEGDAAGAEQVFFGWREVVTAPPAGFDQVSRAHVGLSLPTEVSDLSVMPIRFGHGEGVERGMGAPSVAEGSHR
jgi:hypothetical protein